ncbi:hypothetical protein Gpo141_00014260, partial [Globisporangium polare]
DDDCDDCHDKKKHKSKKHEDDEGEGNHSKHKSTHKHDEDDEDKRSKKHRHRDEDECDDCHDDKKHKSKHKSKKHHEDEEDEDDCRDDCRDEKKHHHKKHHLRREMALSAFQLSMQMAAVGGTGSGVLLSDEIKDDRVFFTAFAQNWCEKLSPAYAELLRATDPHSPGRWRVNGPLKNFDKFSAAFQCKQGTPMNPVKQCPVW